MNESGTTDSGERSDPVSVASRRFEPATTTPAAVRAFARATLAAWDLVPDETVLVAHELATNAIARAAQGFTVALSRRDARVRVEVSAATPDGDPPGADPPVPDGDGSAQGLVLVRGLASTWGVLAHDGGTTLWAEIDVHR